PLYRLTPLIRSVFLPAVLCSPLSSPMTYPPLLLLLPLLVRLADGNHGKSSVQLDNHRVDVSWHTDYEQQTILFRYESPDLAKAKWWLLGFSDHGEFNVSDHCLFDVETRLLWDGFVNSRFEMSRDRQQDCQLEAVTNISFSFRRKFVTCDPKDYAIEVGTNQLIVACSSVATTNFSSPAITAQLTYGLLIVKQHDDSVPNEPDQFTIHVHADKAKVPSDVTTYWCIVQRLPAAVLQRKHHITWLWSNITKGNEHLVHHMMLFHCPSGDQQVFEGNCNDPKKPAQAKACSKVMGAISMGEGPTLYPSEVGLPIGGDGYNPWVMVEMHYNNPPRTAGQVDSSGFDIVLTPHLRPHDAGIMEIGVIYGDANSIPPHQAAFEMTGFCTADCTEKFPEDGINVFYTQMHAHLWFKKLWNSLYRNGVKVVEFNRDAHYSPHWQHILRLDPMMNVRRGDVMATTCVADTRKTNDVVLGGYGIEDEMCISYLYYYPAMDIEMCKSAVSNETLHRFFKQKGVKDGSMTIAQKYKSVEWDDENVRDLSELFATAPVNQHCYRSDGSTFEGHPTNWSRIDHPHITYGAYDKARAREECQALND
ncbi:hypothetical protein PENTCL1PPCAC_25268, partial [Pristionchus entomophagus]